MNAWRRLLRAGLEGTFPASDAVAVTQPVPERYIDRIIDFFKKFRVRCDY